MFKLRQLKALLATLAVFLASTLLVGILYLLFTTIWGQWVVMLAPVVLIAYIVYLQFLDKFNEV